MASPVFRKDEGPTSETAATRNDESTPSVSGSSSGVFANESASEVGSSVSCRFSNGSNAFFSSECTSLVELRILRVEHDSFAHQSVTDLKMHRIL